MVQRSPEYSIAAVSKLTGVGCHALRVWERRYGFPVPQRSPSGHRRFGADQVEMLVLISREIAQGRSVGEVMTDVRAGRLSADEAPAMPIETRWITLLERLLDGDLIEGEAEYSRKVDGLSPARQVLEVISPCLVELGERWFRGECDIYQEHSASDFLRCKLSFLLEAARARNDHPSRRVLVGAVQGDRHEGGILMICLFLELAGWRAYPLGVDMPTREFQKAVDRWKPDALCLSFALSRNINKRFGELARIRSVPVFVGGRSILNYQSLARKHSLHPLVGPLESSIAELMNTVERKNPRQEVALHETLISREPRVS